MAYAALASVAQTINMILNPDRYSLSSQQERLIRLVHKHVIFLQAFLEDFPKKAKSLEERIRDVANNAEDIIEYIMLEDIESRVELEHPLIRGTDEIDSIAWEVMDIRNRRLSTKEVRLGDSPAASSSSRLTPTGKNEMVGFNDELTVIKDRLCGESSERQVIPILGMGGIGKTTLARNAYDDRLIVEHFQIRAWATVSQDYSAHEILSALLDSMKEFNTERLGQSDEENVYKTLKGRRYLIVMDDMWSTKAWDDVKMIFPDDHNGSRIILTTRLSDVAAYPDSSIPLYEMHLMEPDQSWNLLWQKVFTHEDYDPELEDIGKEIARSCGGLPLAIVVIAGVLSTVSKTQASWEEIAKNVNSAVASKEGQFEKILSLSYTHLPHHLRPCFLYMGGFREDHEIRVSKLIKLWVAEGFLKPSLSKSFEDAAQGYLEDLVKRSLVLVTKRKNNGKIKSCSIHDLLRDLCIRLAQEEKFLLHVMDWYVPKVLLKSIENQRRISIAHSNLNFLANIDGSTIHTIICFQRRRSSLGYIEKFSLLRVLDVVESYVNLVPSLVFELFHLRYLALPYPMEIPAAISNLKNLETLIIHPRTTVMDLPCKVYLPLEIWRMPQLRHLVCFCFGLLPNPEGATSALENLQTLSAVEHFICTDRILKMIPNLKKLGICYFQDAKYVEDYHLYNLVYLHQLEKFKLEIQTGFPFRENLNPVFPSTLKKLTLSGWRLPWKDMNVIGSLPNLEVLKLRESACDGDTWETTDGEFLQLKFLLIEKSNLQHWMTESSHFPRLNCLLLHHCLYLSEIPDSIGEIPTLELIEVDDLNKSLVDSAKQIQEDQQSYGNDALQVHCIHSYQSLYTLLKLFGSWYESVLLDDSFLFEFSEFLIIDAAELADQIADDNSN